MSEAGVAGGVLRGANINERGQNVRLRMSVVALAVGLALAIVFARSDSAPALRLVTFIPFFFAAFASLQGLFRTCPARSVAGMREAACGAVLPMGDEDARRASVRVAWLIIGLSFGFAASASGLVYVL